MADTPLTPAARAYSAAFDAYLAAPADGRDDQLVRDLCDDALEEAAPGACGRTTKDRRRIADPPIQPVRYPRCAYVVGDEACGAPARMVGERALCKEHRAAVSKAWSARGRAAP